ncbi:hypothetical protein VOH98_001086 [Clostridium perfringens]
MKNILYKNPVISAIFINILSLIIYISLVKDRIFIFVLFLSLIGVINRQIILNGLWVNREKKIFIYSSFFLMLTIGFTYNVYVNSI